mgnify:CR=1 FL=1
MPRAHQAAGETLRLRLADSLHLVAPRRRCERIGGHALGSQRRHVPAIEDRLDLRFVGNERRRLQIADLAPKGDTPVVELGTSNSLISGVEKWTPESFGIVVNGKRVACVGKDSRGVLYAAGRLLRELRMSPGKITIVHEVAHNIRQIHMDQPMPEKVPTSFLGYSVGHWDGDVLVIETKGTDPRTWIDEEGIIHSDQLYTIERLRKTENGENLENEVTMIDPVFFTRPWVKKINYAWRPDLRIAEYICEENNRNAPEGDRTQAK